MCYHEGRRNCQLPLKRMPVLALKRVSIWCNTRVMWSAWSASTLLKILEYGSRWLRTKLRPLLPRLTTAVIWKKLSAGMISLTGNSRSSALNIARRKPGSVVCSVAVSEWTHIREDLIRTRIMNKTELSPMSSTFLSVYLDRRVNLA